MSIWIAGVPIFGTAQKCVVIPPVSALVYLALPLRRLPRLLPAGIALAALAAVLQIAGLDVLANFAKLAAVTFLAWWFLTYFETAAWVVTVASSNPSTPSIRRTTAGVNCHQEFSRSGGHFHVVGLESHRKLSDHPQAARKKTTANNKAKQETVLAQ